VQKNIVGKPSERAASSSTDVHMSSKAKRGWFIEKSIPEAILVIKTMQICNI
jgi:hypothetical protein